MDDLLKLQADPSTETSPNRPTRFYQPGVLAAYCILANVPLAVFLYGVNVHRRGDVLMGNIIRVTAGLGIVALTITGVYALEIRGLPLLLPGIVIGIGIMQAERPKYEKALREGAKPERWWPPVLFLVFNLIVVILLDCLLPA